MLFLLTSSSKFALRKALAMMKSHSRIKMARRHLNVSQAALATAVGVQRSAVSHWEAPLGKNPTLTNLRKIADLTAVQFEWLATGRGVMVLSREASLDSVATAHALLVDDALEMRMVEAMRSMSLTSKMSLVDIAEQLAKHRIGRARKAVGSLPST
jgi:transcriptional regulator with XRE-family HTH domain